MNPVYYITVDGEDYTKRIEERLVALTIQDQAGMENDTLNVTVDDRDGVIKFPPIGSKIDVWLGYEQKDGHVNPVDKVLFMGRFYLSEFTHSKDANAGMVLTLTAKMLYDGNKMKQPRTGSFHRKTIKQIVEEIAERNELKARVHEDVGSKVIDHIDQNSESDRQFLTRLSIQYGCVMKVSGVMPHDLASRGGVGNDNEILFGPQQKLHELSHIITDDFYIRAEYIESWNYLRQGRGSYAQVNAKYYARKGEDGQSPPFVGPLQHEELPNIETVITPLVTDNASEEERDKVEHNVYQLTPIYSNRKEAEDAAKAKKAQFDASTDTLSFRSIGHPNMMAESKVRLIDFRDEIPTEWLVVKVTHKFDGSGYTNDVDCEIPKDVQDLGGAQGQPSNNNPSP
jgi:hypothetical protein